MKSFKCLVFIVSLLWLAEEIINPVYLIHDAAQITTEAGADDNSNKKVEFKIKENTLNAVFCSFILNKKLRAILEQSFYQSPYLPTASKPPEV